MSRWFESEASAITVLIAHSKILVMLVVMLNRFLSFSKVHLNPQSVLLLPQPQLCPCLHFLSDLQTTVTCSYSAESDHNYRFTLIVNHLNYTAVTWNHNRMRERRRVTSHSFTL